MNVINLAAENLYRTEAFGYKYYYKYFENSGTVQSPVLIFNGFLQSMESWNRFIKYLIGDSSVIIADLPGSGAADPILDRDFDLDLLSECTKKILNELGVERVNIISASYGAGTAFNFARNYPDSVNDLILAGVMNKLEDDLKTKLNRIEELLAKSNSKESSELVIEILLNSDKKYSIKNFPLVRKLLLRQLNNLKDEEKKRYYENYKHLLNHPPLDISLEDRIRKLIFTGEYDHFTKPEYGRSIAAKLNNCSFTTIKNADHLFHLEQLDTAVSLIKNFFGNRPLHTVRGLNGIEVFGTP